MVNVSYEFLGLGVALLFVGTWMLGRIVRRRRDGHGTAPTLPKDGRAEPRSDVEHRALMFLMTQKTDEVLAALSRTINEERQKLGAVVRNPSIAEAVSAYRTDAPQAETRPRSELDRIMPLAGEGLSTPAIARKLNLPEAEICMVMKLHAA